MIGSLRRAPKKVLVLDLDNTLWGGVVADDGLEGIEMGDTSPRGEAFKAFQKYIASLKQRGVLLAVCSKNDHAKAAEVFEKHPEMVLRMEDIVSFKANWEPKSDNIRQMAAELNLGLDSFVFVDDNPAEIEIVRQFAPEVDHHPARARSRPNTSRSCRIAGCSSRATSPPRMPSAPSQYHSEARRKAFSADGHGHGFLSRIARDGRRRSASSPRWMSRGSSQLINKSNQFNLTTRRRTEADILALMRDPALRRLFHAAQGPLRRPRLISIVIGQVSRTTRMKIDTWLMSCRVLKRQVEEEVLNELARLADKRGCARLEGVYLPTAKNEMVRDFYTAHGFHFDRRKRKAPRI